MPERLEKHIFRVYTDNGGQVMKEVTIAALMGVVVMVVILKLLRMVKGI